MKIAHVGRVLPLLIACICVADVAARFVSIDRLCFQAWECMTRYQEPGSIFQANRRFTSTHTHGNLSNMGNLPALRQVRPQTFTTDANGFRNAPGAERQAPGGVVVGDSFVAGYGISDDETFPVQLSAATGRRFYNAGGPYAYLATVRLVKSRMNFASGPVVIVWTESEPVGQLAEAERLAGEGDRRMRAMRGVLGSSADKVRSLARGWWYTSPLKIVAEKTFLAMADDRVLPNTYRDKVVERRLRSGETMLFYPPDVDGFHRQRDTREAREFILDLASGLHREGVTPLVLIAPSKYTVYYPLLEGSPPPPGDAVHPLRRLETELRAHGVIAIDLTGRFQQQARRDLDERRYIYWLDDTHWNRDGVAAAVDVAAREWFASGAALERASQSTH